MTPIILVIFLAYVVSSNGDVYLQPPPGYLPPNHKYSDSLEPPPSVKPSQEPTQHTAEASHHLEPFATMEIFKDRSQRQLIQPNYHIIPSNHKPVHVEVYPVQENPPQIQGAQQMQEAERAETVSRETDLASALSHLNFFDDKSTPLRPASTPPVASQQFSTAFPSTEGDVEIEGRPSHYYPVQQNNYSPLTDFYTPSFGQNANLKKLESIVEKPNFPKKLKPKKKYSSKIQKFPKKYKTKNNKLRVKPVSEIDEFSLNSGSLGSKLRVRPTSSEIEDFARDSGSFSGKLRGKPTSSEIEDFSRDSGSFNSKLRIKPTSSEIDDYSLDSGNLKLNSNLQIKPVSEVEDFSVDSLKNKRKIPLSYYKKPQESGNSFSGELNSYNSFPSHKGNTHADFSLPTGGSSDGDRVEFQMYGMDGPDSYKFGYDTGKGHNRHFRYEERDNHGKVKGHYGFYDQEGKMSMMHYEADPHTGFRAGPYQHPENHHEFN